MPLFAKPQFNSVWAAAGSRLTPETAKVSQGWVVEIPPHEYDNWIQNRQDALLAHINQLGIPQWDATVEYQAGKSYTQGLTTGNIYKALTTHTNINPELDIQGNWMVAFEVQGTALLKSQNLADIPDKALARTNLGIATTEFYDSRYLVKNNNFSDVPNKASARSNLGLGDSSTRNVGTSAGTVAAGDDSRIVNATPTTRAVTAGVGLVGGGNLTSDRTISLGIPSTINATSTNSTTATSHTHYVDLAAILPTNVTNLTGSRAFGVTYTNATSKYRMISVICRDTVAGNLGVQLFINGTIVSQAYGGANAIDTLVGWIPPGGSYTVTRSDDNDAILTWVEYL